MMKLFLIVSCALVANVFGGTSSVPTCQQGWRLNPTKDACIKVVRDRKADFQAARDHCKTIGGEIASSMTTKEQIDDVNDLIGCREHFWIGIVRNQQTNVFYSIAGHRVPESAPFVPGHPRSSGNNNCVTLKREQWYDQPCSRRYFFMCQAVIQLDMN